jgi:lactoylglutathione lyase
MNIREYTCLMLLICVLFVNAACSQTPSGQQKAKLNHTAIYVSELKKAAAFYGEVLGLDTIPEPFRDGRHIWYSLAPGVALHVIQGQVEKQVHPRNHHTCFSVSSVDSFIEVLKKNNIQWKDRDGVKNTTTTRPDGVKQIWFTDPDGYWIEINDAKE